MTTKYSGPPATVTCSGCGAEATRRTPGLAAKFLAKHSCEHHLELAARARRVEERKTREGVKRDCACKIARHEHGTPTAYKVDKCRCRACMDARTAAESSRAKQIAFGRYDSGRVDAEPVRAHVRWLMEYGISYKQVAKLSGIALSTMTNLIYGHPERGHAPYPRAHRATAEKILAVRPTMENMARGRHVDVTGSRRRMQALVAIGWSQSRLAHRLGVRPSNLWKFMNAEQCSASMALRVRNLYEELWNSPQIGTDRHGRQSASRARNYAKARGWLPPLAWDDDTIDDPSFVPVMGGREYLKNTIAEDVEFLAKTGANKDEIAARLGVTWSFVCTSLRSAGRRDLIGLVTGDDRTNARQARRGRAA